MSPTDQVLLTGATGFIGFRTLLTLLEQSYLVRCAIRDLSKASALLCNPALSSRHPNPPPSFVSVPDITSPGAYTAAIKDVTHVIHVASPVSGKNVGGHLAAEQTFIRPAVQGALEILDAAYATPSVRRVVITSSIVAIVPSRFLTGQQRSEQVFGPASRQEVLPGPYASEVEAYGASKTAQQLAIEEWVREKRPAFDVVTIHPAYVFGRADLVRDEQAMFTNTNRLVLGVAKGARVEVPNVDAAVHVDDVALAQVEALKLGESEKVRAFVLSVPIVWEDLPKIVGKCFGKEVEKGWLSVDGEQKSASIRIDGSETERVLGFKYEGFEEMVRSAVGHYIEIKTMENAGEH